MLTADAVAHFGTKTAIAQALDITPSAVSAWGELVPPYSAMRLAQMSRGRLKFDAEAYAQWNKPKRQKAKRSGRKSA